MSVASTIAGQVSSSVGGGFFKSFATGLFEKAKHSSQGAQYLAYTGAGNIVTDMIFGGAKRTGFFGTTLGFFDTGLDLVGLGAVFMGPTALAVLGGAYLFKGLLHVGIAGICAVRRDWAGASAHLITGGLTLGGLALSINVGSVCNKATKVVKMKPANAKLFEIGPSSTKGVVFDNEAMGRIKNNVTRLEGQSKKAGEFVTAFEEQKKGVEKRIAEDITKTYEKNGRKITVKAEHEMPDAKKAAQTAGAKPQTKLEPLSQEHISDARTMLEKGVKEAEKDVAKAKGILEKAKAEADSLEKEIAQLEKQKAKLQALEIKRKKLKTFKENMKKLEEAKSAADTKLKDTTKLKGTFEKDVKELDVVNRDLWLARARKGRLEGLLGEAKEVEAEAIKLNDKIPGNTPGIDFDKDGVGKIIEKHKKTLCELRTEPRRFLRLAAKKSYGREVAEKAVGQYDATVGFAQSDDKVGYIIPPVKRVRTGLRRFIDATRPDGTHMDMSKLANLTGEVPVALAPLASG